MQAETFSLFGLNQFIRQVMILNFPDAIWLTAEIAQLDYSKGHWFLQFVEKEAEGEEVIAHASAVLWARNGGRLKRKLGANFDAILQEGTEVKVQVQVDFHERYGYKLIVTDIDLHYTIGQYALKRQQNLEVLRELELVGKNAEKPLPIVVQRIAVISSKTAAGLQDFVQQIQNNLYGYNIEYTLFEAAMQGAKTESDVLTQLKKIRIQKDHFDAVVIIRGGGAKLDLAAFDSLELSKAIALFDIPVLVGIGHETDQTLLDMVAHLSLKTPTAVAAFIVNHNAQYETYVQERVQLIAQLAQRKWFAEKERLKHLSQQVELYSNHQLLQSKEQLRYFFKMIQQGAQHRLQTENQKMDAYQTIVELLKPASILSRGFALVYKNGKAISHIDKLEEGDLIEHQFENGVVQSKVLSKKQQNERQ